MKLLPRTHLKTFSGFAARLNGQSSRRCNRFLIRYRSGGRAVDAEPGEADVAPTPLTYVEEKSTELLSTARCEEAVSPFPDFAEWNRNTFLMRNCEAERCLSVAVLLSGGVDSSVALALLKAAGHDVRAFYLKIWFQEDFENFWNACPWEEDIYYANEVCEKLHVPLEIVPLTSAYWDRVASKTVAEIKAGRTPNPDMLCNSQIKFGAFVEFLEKQKMGFDRIASGHYARIVRNSKPEDEDRVHLQMSADHVKDQTYFLAQLSQKQLARCMFPLGDLKKKGVRELAGIADLPTCKRKDSQGICFLGKVRFNAFIERHLGKWPGLILEEGTKKQLGFHDGYWFYTIGQRSGLRLSGGPWYVSKKDVRWNVIFVRKLGSESSPLAGRYDAFSCQEMNWIGSPPARSRLTCKVRHGELAYGCCVEQRQDDWLVRLDGQDQGLASGQFAVFYQDGRCLGSGIINSSSLIVC